MRVNILSPGFVTPNGRAFLFPLVVWRGQLRSAGIEICFFDKLGPGLTDCDILGIDSKYYASHWMIAGDHVEAEIAKLSGQVKKLLWFDTTDSSGCVHARPLPYVTAWIKNQVLRDRSKYLKSIYANGRIFAEYVYERGKAEDHDPSWSEPVSDPALLNKIHVGWNSGLADYSLWGPTRMAIFNRLPSSKFLRFPGVSALPFSARKLGVSSRFGLSYARDSVAWQRREIANLLGNQLLTNKLSRRAYLQELKISRIVVSPFGLGEITLKDFEVFMMGGALLKPTMNHMETWPNFFRPGDTMETHAWDLSDFQEKLAGLLADDERRLAIAQRGQDLYRCYTVGSEAPDLFIHHFQSLLAIGD